MPHGGPLVKPHTKEEGVSASDQADLARLFHRLNNQLGIILANAELLEAKCPDEMNRGRASQVVLSVLDAIGTAKQIKTTFQTLARPLRDR